MLYKLERTHLVLVLIRGKLCHIISAQRKSTRNKRALRKTPRLTNELLEICWSQLGSLGLTGIRSIWLITNNVDVAQFFSKLKLNLKQNFRNHSIHPIFSLSQNLGYHSSSQPIDIQSSSCVTSPVLNEITIVLSKFISRQLSKFQSKNSPQIVQFHVSMREIVLVSGGKYCMQTKM